MAAALTPPLAVAAIVLCAAGIGKLRSPAAAARALAELGVRASPLPVRALAVVELAIGVWSLVRPGIASTVLFAALYAAFGAVSLLLARARSSCGCFGERDIPASASQSALSACIAAIALCAAIWQAHGVSWLVARSVPTAVVLVLGIVAAAYATVLAYTELPLAWAAWAGDSR